MTGSRLAREIFGEPECGVCKHCDVPIIRWPNRAPEYASRGDERWIHNPSNGFRLRRCRGMDTEAEPAQ